MALLSFAVYGNTRYEPVNARGNGARDPAYDVVADRTDGYLDLGSSDDTLSSLPNGAGAVMNPTYLAQSTVGGVGNPTYGMQDPRSNGTSARHGNTRSATYAAAPPTNANNRSSNGGVYDSVGAITVNPSGNPSRSGKPPSVKRALKPASGGATTSPHYAEASLAGGGARSNNSTYDEIDDMGC